MCSSMTHMYKPHVYLGIWNRVTFELQYLKLFLVKNLSLLKSPAVFHSKKIAFWKQKNRHETVDVMQPDPEV